MLCALEREDIEISSQVEAPEFEATRHVVDARRRVSYHEAGSGPGLLLLHGSGPGVSGWSNFRGNLATFSTKFRTVVLDQPGFGLSDPPALEGQPYHEYAIEAIVDVLDATGLESVDIVGNSMGARVAAEFALALPGRARRLVL